MGKQHSGKPVIGVTGPGKRGKGNWWFFKFLLLWLGAEPVHIIPGEDRKMDELDALILSGGADINPKRYGREQESLPYRKKSRSRNVLRILFYPLIQLYKEAFGIGSSEVNLKRDEMEFRLLDAAIVENKPVLGICRGMQLMNVFLGGTLYHDINSLGYAVRYKKSVLPRKWITILNSSLLYEIIGHSRCRINSLHNQGVDKLGEGLQIIGRDENELTQALEKANGSFFLGVQWHPEYLPYLKNQRKIFKALINATAPAKPTANR